MHPEDSKDQVFIRGLVVSCHIGVPDEERAHSQDILVTTLVLVRAGVYVDCNKGFCFFDDDRSA